MIDPTHTPPKKPEHPLKQLKLLLHDSLLPHGDGDLAMLADQAKILDLAFRHIVWVGTDVYTDPQYLRPAFRAQNQCLHTLKAINTLKNNKSGAPPPVKT